MRSPTAAARTGPSVSPDLASCPSDIDLACFVDGQLDEHARQAVLRHLDVCDDCRDVVATAVEALPAEPDAAAPLDPDHTPGDPSRRPA